MVTVLTITGKKGFNIMIRLFDALIAVAVRFLAVAVVIFIVGQIVENLPIILAAGL